MRDNILATGSAGKTGSSPAVEKLKRKKYNIRIITASKRDRQWKVEGILKTDFIDDYKFSRNGDCSAI
jgi:nucleoside-diphosphate-sugar epimerase